MTLNESQRRVLFDPTWRPADLLAALSELQRFDLPVYAAAMEPRLLNWTEFMEQWARLTGVVTLSLYRPIDQWQRAMEVWTRPP